MFAHMNILFVSRSDISLVNTNTSDSETQTNDNKILQAITDSLKNERVNTTKESIHDAEMKAAKQRELIPYETRIKQFREMLAEKQVGHNR
jgi:hypothetical protein